MEDNRHSECWNCGEQATHCSKDYPGVYTCWCDDCCHPDDVQQSKMELLEIWKSSQTMITEEINVGTHQS